MSNQPFAAIERDQSIKAWEVSIGFDGTNHDVFQIFFFDDGRTELKRWGSEEFQQIFVEEIIHAIDEGAKKFKKKGE